MKANLMDLNSLLYEQLERINDDELKGEELDEQLKKSKAINDVAKTIVQNSMLVFRAARYAEENGVTGVETRLIGADA